MLELSPLKQLRCLAPGPKIHLINLKQGSESAFKTLQDTMCTEVWGQSSNLDTCCWNCRCRVLLGSTSFAAPSSQHPTHLKLSHTAHCIPETWMCFIEKKKHTQLPLCIRQLFVCFAWLMFSPVSAKITSISLFSCGNCSLPVLHDIVQMELNLLPGSTSGNANQASLGRVTILATVIC